MPLFHFFFPLSAFLFVFLFCSSVTAHEAPATSAPRLVTVDWTIAETLIELGAPPVGLAQTASYRNWVKALELPSGVIDIGLRSQPNRELLMQLKPDQILISPMFSTLEPVLSSIAPVTSISMYQPGGDVWEHLYQATRRIASVAGRPEKGEQLLTGLETYLSSLTTCFKKENQQLLVVQFIDDRHMRIYGKQSLFDAVITRMGLSNAWQEETNYWGFSTIGIERLAKYHDAQLVIVEPLPVGVLKQLSQSKIWSALPVVQQKNYVYLPPVWSFGGIASARRFASELAKALLQDRSVPCEG